MSNRITKLAKGQQCQIRIPGICNRDDATTVLAHYRLIGLSGIGMKSPDIIGAWACSACHDEVDGRTRALDRSNVRLMHAEGVLRTQSKLMEMGKLKW